MSCWHIRQQMVRSNQPSLIERNSDMGKASTKKSSVARKNRPEKKITPVNSGISVAIWLNSADTETGKRYYRSVTIEPRRYYDKTAGEWKDSPSFSAADLPLLLYALEQARDFVFSEPLPDQSPETQTNSAITDGEVPF
jgi:hypothetical protein